MISVVFSNVFGRLFVFSLLLKATFAVAKPADGASATTSATGTTVSGLPTGWEYYGCWIDGVNGRILTNEYDSAQLTLESCVFHCISGNYTIAGLEYSTQCFCDDAIHNGGVLATSDSDCNDPCGGDSTHICGGGSRVSLFSIGTPQVFQPPAAQKDDLPTNWKYGGCLQDNVVSKSNPNEDDNTVNISTFPYRLPENDTNMTATTCITRCQAYGYNAAGIEVGTQCFCGDVENILVASDPLVTTSPLDQGGWKYDVTPVIVDDSQCTVPCSGNSQYFCGANNLLTYYYWNGTEPLYSWDIHQGESAGKYSQLIGGVTVPLITAQVITGKVTFVEKTQTGFPNGTGVYELDLSLVDKPDSYKVAWREMNEMITDVFCAAGLILPDKAGRQVTFGGWNGDSNFGVRLYLPDGSDGVNGTNQWQEDPSKLTLQLPRWYPSAMIMTNGSILIVGGEISENNDEQPTLELLPATGVLDSSASSGYSNTTVYLDFLDRTTPDNLYPYICVLPSGGIFIGYYNEARVLDEVNFSTTKILPNIPGAVNDDTGGRTYSLEGKCCEEHRDQLCNDWASNAELFAYSPRHNYWLAALGARNVHSLHIACLPTFLKSKHQMRATIQRNRPISSFFMLFSLFAVGFKDLMKVTAHFPILPYMNHESVDRDGIDVANQVLNTEAKLLSIFTNWMPTGYNELARPELGLIREISWLWLAEEGKVLNVLGLDEIMNKITKDERKPLKRLTKIKQKLRILR